MLGRIIGGLLIAVGGAACCYYSYQLVSTFGRNARAERNLWGTRNAVVLLGIFFMVLWVLMIFWVFSFSNPADQVPQWFGTQDTL